MRRGISSRSAPRDPGISSGCIFLDEQATGLAALGLVLIVAGILLIAGLTHHKHKLKEESAPQKIAGAACIVGGVISLAFASPA